MNSGYAVVRTTESIPVNQNTNHVLVTGGCGYIGSHTAKALKQKGYRVTILDWTRRDHTLKFCDDFVHADYDSETTYQYIKLNKPGAIVHCAGYISVGESVQNPSKYYINNVAKTARFLQQLITKSTPPAIVFSSSASVYGNPASVPITEDFPIQPMSPYGQTKAMTEQMLKSFSHAYGLPSICLRYFNACGADPYNYELGQELGAGHIIARLLEARLRNQTFTLNGTDFSTRDGTCIRDYIHVWDLSQAHVLSIEHLFEHKQTLQLNLGTNMGFSNKEVVDTVNRVVGPVEVEYGPRRAGDPDCLIADATHAKSVLGWQPQYSTLPVIVDTAWKWYNGQRI